MIYNIKSLFVLGCLLQFFNEPVWVTLFHQALQEDLKQAHRLAEMYREQCITLETELSQIREEGDVGREIFKVTLLYWCLCL